MVLVGLWLWSDKGMVRLGYGEEILKDRFKVMLKLRFW